MRNWKSRISRLGAGLGSLAYPQVRVNCDGLEGEGLAIVKAIERGLCRVDADGTPNPLNAVFTTDIWRDVGQALNGSDNADRYMDALPRIVELHKTRVSGGDPNSPRLISIEFVARVSYGAVTHNRSIQRSDRSRLNQQDNSHLFQQMF